MKPLHTVMWECVQAAFNAGKKSVPVEPRMMWEVGVEGDRFHPHEETPECASAGCEEVLRR